MEALRDVESRLAAPRTSPLQQIVEQRKIPETEQAELVGFLQTANTTDTPVVIQHPFSFTVACGVWSSSTSRWAHSDTRTRVRCTSTLTTLVSIG